MTNRELIISGVSAGLGALVMFLIMRSKKLEKTSSAMGDGDFKKGSYEKAWNN